MNYIKSFFFGFILIFWYLILMVVFDGNHVKMITAMLISIFIFCYFFSYKYNKKRLLDFIFLICPFIILCIVSGILINDFTRILQYLLFVPIITLLSFWYVKTNKAFIIAFMLCFSYVAGFCLFVSIFTYLSNFNGEKNLPFPGIDIINEKKQNITLSKNKIIILDFWSTSCGICFSKFPDLEATYQKYKNFKNIEIYAVNFPLRNDNERKTMKILDSLGYNFPKLYAKSDAQIEKRLKFNTFPHLIIIKNGKIRFDGMFETKKHTFIYSIEYEIEKLLKESINDK